jgi:hypothetical protein
MSEYVRVSDEKNARWHAMRHKINMGRLLEAEERARVARTIAQPDTCPHCGHALNPRSR